jgi:hypothetical protein
LSVVTGVIVRKTDIATIAFKVRSVICFMMVIFLF